MDWIRSKNLKNLGVQLTTIRVLILRRITPKAIRRNLIIIHGRVDDVLNNFLKIEKQKFSLIHFDVDFYRSTHCAFKALLPCLSPGTLILCDELRGHPG